ncbi:hypothetical protein QQP08_017492 [Theobroma cacao]|nr:hypothetical protein QQP08_017492 [Theobroma cacao]
MTNEFSYVNLLLEMQKYKFLFPSDDEIFGRFKYRMCFANDKGDFIVAASFYVCVQSLSLNIEENPQNFDFCPQVFN